MIRSAKLALAPVLAVVCAGAACVVGGADAVAQTALAPPGVETLPTALRPYAVIPTVLTTGASDTLCLEYKDEEDVRNRTVQMAPCAERWNQSVWIESLDTLEGPNKLRIRIGDLACLVAPDRAEWNVLMSICGDGRAGEVWTVRDSQLVDSKGLCLDGSGHYFYDANQLRPTVTTCNPAAPGQNWRIEPMRAALNRTEYPPAIIGARDFELGYTTDVFEQLRPKFVVRALTSAEQAEVKRLKGAWRGIDLMLQARIKRMAYSDIVTQKLKAKTVSIPWPVLARLSQLAESGDREAMQAVMQGFAALRDSADWGVIKGWEQSGFPHGGHPGLAYDVASALANVWAMHYWQRHGPDRLAAYAMSSGCGLDFRGRDTCMGFSARVVPEGPEANIYQWIETGKAKHAVAIEDVVFKPTSKDFATREAQFFANISNGDMSRLPETQVAESVVFAKETGRLELWDAVTLTTRLKYHSQYSPQMQDLSKLLRERREDAEWRAKFAAFLANPSPDRYQQWSIQEGLREQSDADLLTYAARFLVTEPSLIERVCANGRDGTYACTNGRKVRNDQLSEIYASARAVEEKAAAERAVLAQAQAEREEQERLRWVAMNKDNKPGFWDQLAGLFDGMATAMAQGDQMVTVRQYDSQGNFTGTAQMTRTQAIGMGATVD